MPLRQLVQRRPPLCARPMCRAQLQKAFLSEVTLRTSVPHPMPLRQLVQLVTNPLFSLAMKSCTEEQFYKLKDLDPQHSII